MNRRKIAYSFEEANAPERHTTQYFEMFANRYYHQGCSACTRHSLPWVTARTFPSFTDDVWELYAPDDWSQANNIATSNPEKLKELQQVFLVEAAKYHVFPLDDRKAKRFNSDFAGRPRFTNRIRLADPSSRPESFERKHGSQYQKQIPLSSGRPIWRLGSIPKSGLT